MKIVLITPTPPDINAFGVRTLSAVLKAKGHSTKIIFLPGGIELLRFDADFIYQYPQKTLDQIAAICENADLIGFSLMSQYFDRAVQVSDYLRTKFDTPVIWGGIHPTHRPEQCMDHCDIICRGEGEFALTELAARIEQGKDFSDIPSCWVRRDSEIVKNPAGPVIENCDELPFCDYDIKDHYIFNWQTNDIMAIDHDIMREITLKLPYFKDTHLLAYRTMTSRGCPHRCSYCASSAMKHLRRRSVDNVITELEDILQKFPYIKIISFFDDTFFAASTKYFTEFAQQYKKRIGLPFHAQCSPTTISHEKLELLLDAGLYYTEMGIQTGSQKTKEIFRRTTPNEKILEAAALIGRYSDKMLTPCYHVILDNYWETKDDVLDTLNLLLRLPGKFSLAISSLVLFPGTELNDKARAEGKIKDELNEILRKPFTYPKGTYLNYLIYLSGFPIVPRFLLKLLACKALVGIFHRQESMKIFEILYRISGIVRLLTKGVKSLLLGDFKRIINYFRLAR